MLHMQINYVLYQCAKLKCANFVYLLKNKVCTKIKHMPKCWEKQYGVPAVASTCNSLSMLGVYMLFLL